MRAKCCVDDTNSSQLRNVPGLISRRCFDHCGVHSAGGRGMTLAPAIAEESFQ